MGTTIDRFGRRGGAFVAPKGTPFPMRALPPDSSSSPYEAYRLLKPIKVQSGPAAPAFGQIGMGMQPELPASVSDLLESQHLEVIK